MIGAWDLFGGDLDLRRRPLVRFADWRIACILIGSGRVAQLAKIGHYKTWAEQ